MENELSFTQRCSRAQRMLTELCKPDTYEIAGMDGVYHWGTDDMHGYSAYVAFEVEEPDDYRALIRKANQVGTVHASREASWVDYAESDEDLDIGSALVLCIKRPDNEADIKKFLKPSIHEAVRKIARQN